MAQVLASFNHPNIAAIHGLEQVDGTNFLVLELVEGETLADQLKRGPICPGFLFRTRRERINCMGISLGVGRC